MVIKYIGEADMASKGINFIVGFEYDVTDDVAKYMKEHFPNKFEFTEVTKSKNTSAKATVDTTVEAPEKETK